ncbi:MAG: HNH endonuclease signature motif containing protein [Methylophilus sp.]|nr:HNH endonuclease signature motif containing protein [Methylophilus sp.]
MEFFLTESDVKSLSKELHGLIVKYCQCRYCGNSANIDLIECPCQRIRRHNYSKKLEETFNKIRDDKKELNKVSREMFGQSLSHEEWVYLIESSGQQTVRYGGKFEVTHENHEYLKKQLYIEQKRLYSKRAAIRRRARQLQAEGSFTKDDILAIWQLQSGACYFCGISLKHPSEKHSFHIDHLIPLYHGGSEWPENLSLLCQSCNNIKYTKSEKEFWSLCERIHGKELIEKQKEKAKQNRPIKLKLSRARRKFVDENL